MFFIPVSVWLYDCGPHSQRASHPRPPDFHADLWGNYRDHPCEKFFVISLRKFRENEGEFYMRIFPPPFSVESLGILSKCNLRGPSHVEKPSDDLMSLFGELKCLQVWGNFPLILNAISKFSPEFSMWIFVSLTTQISAWIPSLNEHKPWRFPRGIHEILPAGLAVHVCLKIAEMEITNYLSII